MPRKKKRLTRGQSKHPGVVIRKRTHASGRITYQARWTDPRTGKTVEQSLSTGELRLTTKEAREDWAIRQSQELQRMRRELEAGRVARSAPESIAGAIEEYLEDRRLEKLREGTLASYRPSLELFAEWAGDVGLSALEDLRPNRLVDFRKWLLGLEKLLPRKGGKRGEKAGTGEPRSAATANRDLRQVKAFFSWARRSGYLPHVDPEDIKERLKRVAEDQARAKFLRVPEIQKLLKACLRHDAVTFRETREEHRGARTRGSTLKYRPFAPLVMTVLLTGCRIGEALSGLWERVHLGDGREEWIVEATATKTRRERAIDLGVCPSVARLLAVLRLQESDAVYLFGGAEPMPKHDADNARKRLIKRFGAPPFTWQALRATCASFLVNAPGIFDTASIYRESAQLGHSIAVAERNYLGLIRGIPAEAETLEQAMQIEGIVDKIVESVSGGGERQTRRTG